MGEPVQLSAAAISRLETELVELKGPRRAQIQEAVLTARQMGSIVENGDYAAAKEEERLVEDRIAYLEDLLSRAVPAGDGPAGVVAPGAVVAVRFDGDDADETYLFGEAAEKGAWPVCTPSSPMGRALAGARAGDERTYRTPSGATVRLRVVSVG
jgi:transcription elongation factor GreA